MSVEDWAREQAEGLYLGGEHPEVFRIGHASGIVHAFDAILSDEAVDAAALDMAERQKWPNPTMLDNPNLANDLKHAARAALQSAIAAVTEGEQ